MGNKKPLSKCHITLEGAFNNASYTPDNILKWVTRQHGHLLPKFTEETTHLVASREAWKAKKGNVRAALEAKKHGQKVMIVSYDWLDDSLKGSSKKKEGPYLWETLDGAVRVDAVGGVGGDDGLKKKGAAFAPGGLLVASSSGRANGYASEASNVSIEAANRLPRREEPPVVVDPFSRGSRKARNELLSANHHIYRDSTGFAYEVLLTKVDIKKNRNERHNLTLTLQIYESNAFPHTYAVNAHFAATKQLATHNVPCAVGSTFLAAFRVFQKLFKEKTGVDWEVRHIFSERKKEVEAMGRAKGDDRPRGTLEVHKPSGKWGWVREGEEKPFEERKAEYFLPTSGGIGHLQMSAEEILVAEERARIENAEKLARAEEERAAREIEEERTRSELAREAAEALREHDEFMQNASAGTPGSRLQIEGEDSLVREVQYDGLPMMRGAMGDWEEGGSNSQIHPAVVYDEDTAMETAMAASLLEDRDRREPASTNAVYEREAIEINDSNPGDGTFDADDEASSPFQPDQPEDSPPTSTHVDGTTPAQTSETAEGVDYMAFDFEYDGNKAEDLPPASNGVDNAPGVQAANTTADFDSAADLDNTTFDTTNFEFDDFDPNNPLPGFSTQDLIDFHSNSVVDDDTDDNYDLLAHLPNINPALTNNNHQDPGETGFALTGAVDAKPGSDSFIQGLREAATAVSDDAGAVVDDSLDAKPQLAYDDTEPTSFEGSGSFDWGAGYGVEEVNGLPFTGSFGEGEGSQGVGAGFPSSSDFPSGAGSEVLDENTTPDDPAAVSDDFGPSGESAEVEHAVQAEGIQNVGPETQIAAQLYGEMMQAAMTDGNGASDRDAEGTVSGKRASPAAEVDGDAEDENDDDDEPVRQPGKRRKLIA
ncbi:hypothetical protein MBLNU230_g6653t1 [Neophaeotheca triangularis]